MKEAAQVFEEILGIPAHPLIVHAAVVFVPLQVLAAVAYVLVPFVRRFTTWFVVALAVVAPLSALAAKLSGDAFRIRLVRNGTSDENLLTRIDQHREVATMALYASIALAMLMAVSVIIYRSQSGPLGAPGDGRSGRAGASTGSTVLTVILALAVLGVGATTGYYVFRAGDTGAHLAWQGM